MAEVRLNEVTKKFGNFTAVDRVTLEVRDGEFVVLVGPSGCGKTTSLRMVAGLEDATGGDIFIGNRRVNDVPPKDRDIAMVFQNYALYPHMDVYNNMAFGLKLRKVPKKEIERRVRDAAELLGITEKLKSKPRELSGGQRQRVALGRAIVRDPKVFLFDEPLSNLDAKLRVRMRAELAELHLRLKTTTVYVTHDQVEAMTLGQRVAVMKDGVVMQYDDPQTIYDRPANMFVAGFIGSPPMNFLDARLVSESGRLYVQGKGFKLLVPEERASDALRGQVGKEVVFGLRPEDIRTPEMVREEKAGRSFKGRVRVREPLGDELIVYADCAGDEIVAKLDPHLSIQPGQDVTFVAMMERFHIFDKETEQAVV
ncbi:MAG: Maltodextrin ABC transporter, ATP-binding protein MsmX [Candidatus Bipolaricaulis sibiricus]|uniref:Maltodextrin ABC transporter, ATP-binding protein MsmX n=1 Tax=Bipolaricaulis sibiricus TaxID=2501609 RepID=A0A410FS86_BIPS1|nr:MAG: Maltodextrin ABC transporter, ATP-binding protein MsmX [Candidatus Bipolaricaulis sibiricus]